jgi:hypothetical protein
MTDTIHYTYTTPAYNGLYTAGHTTAFCGATDQFSRMETTEALSYVTCQDCKEARTALYS